MRSPYTFRCVYCGFPVPHPLTSLQKQAYFEDVVCNQCGKTVTEAHKISQLKVQVIDSFSVYIQR
ncbi:hypothetical protein [Aquirhabdus sp.]|uniref:hypothetical protein n=1 Tax=Aquirhabdus sp. TaxID=2824160 RepID=UPI00396CFA2A